MKSYIIALLIFSTIFSFTTFNLNAQIPHFSIFAHGLYATALDNSSQNFYNGGLGAVGGVTLGTQNSRAVASIGYSEFFADKNRNTLGNESYIPVKIGLRQYLPLSLHLLFVQGNIGAGFVSNKNATKTDTRFAADIGAGAHLGPFEAALVWDSFKEPKPYGFSSWLTFQLGFNFGL